MKNYTFGIFSFAAGTIAIFLLVYGVLKLLSVEAGNVLDWVIGIGTLIWLMIVVLVPWNIYFEALEVLQEAQHSKKRNIQFDATQLGYVHKLRKGSLIIALSLHFISALGLYAIAWAQISVVGYYGSGAAILLTLLRPSIRAYEYISYRLSHIKQEVLYPRNDLSLLQDEINNMKNSLQRLTEIFNTGSENSWVRQLQHWQNDTQTKLLAVQNNLNKLDKENEAAHQKLTNETRHAIAQLSEDGKFIDNIVEIIRFIKKV